MSTLFETPPPHGGWGSYGLWDLKTETKNLRNTICTISTIRKVVDTWSGIKVLKDNQSGIIQ